VTPAARPRDIAEDLADFTTTTRLLTIAAFAIGIGAIGAYVALGLLKLIGLFTNLFFFQRVSTALVTPETHTLGPFVILVPVAGALIIGVMARYGSRRSSSTAAGSSPKWRSSNRSRRRSQSDRADRSAQRDRSS
jgi:hypothetical protein